MRQICHLSRFTASLDGSINVLQVQTSVLTPRHSLSAEKIETDTNGCGMEALWHLVCDLR